MRILKNILIVTGCFLLFVISACKKQEGPGGHCSIHGKVHVKKMSLTSIAVVGEYPGAYENVYIIYGGNSMIDGNKVQANPEGEFEFQYLQPGKYKIYTYTRDSMGVSQSKKLAIIRDVELKKNKSVDVGTFQIYK